MDRLLAFLMALAMSWNISAAQAQTRPAELEIIEDMDRLAQTYAQVALDSQSDKGAYHLLPDEERDFYLTQVYGLPAGGWGGSAIYTAGGVDAREIMVLSGVNGEEAYEAASALETYRESRAADFYGYAPEQAEMVENGVVLEGNIVALLICTDPNEARAAMEEQLSNLVIKPYDPEDIDEPYDWTREYDEEGRRIFDPPGDHDMTLYDTSAIKAAWAAGDPSGLSEKDAAILAKCREIMKTCVKPGMTDFEKELALHDWLMANCESDATVRDPQTPQGRPDNTNPYGMLVNGYGICLGYATTFQLLMDLAGVECITVVGAARNSSQDHAWNMVRLEGEWYHVDAGWNDPITEFGVDVAYLSGWGRHYRYFNVTSDYMRDTDHQWDYDAVPETAATRFRWEGVGEMLR